MNWKQTRVFRLISDVAEFASFWCFPRKLHLLILYTWVMTTLHLAPIKLSCIKTLKSAFECDVASGHGYRGTKQKHKLWANCG
jgi:hypothetical protein